MAAVSVIMLKIYHTNTKWCPNRVAIVGISAAAGGHPQVGAQLVVRLRTRGRRELRQGRAGQAGRRRPRPALLLASTGRRDRAIGATQTTMSDMRLFIYRNEAGSEGKVRPCVGG